MPADPVDASSNTGVAEGNSSLPSPSSSTNNSVTPGTNADNSANLGNSPKDHHTDYAILEDESVEFDADHLKVLHLRTYCKAYLVLVHFPWSVRVYSGHCNNKRQTNFAPISDFGMQQWRA
ncbi:hypothetical protein BKA57DRAFT_443528 [Linnemannia elongata]|nr:hypothetical protein BKA57DRAFT_443528 [Linnemannia elongata]